MKRQKVSITEVPGRKSPWMVTYYESGRPHRTFYRTKKEADDQRRQLVQILGAGLSPADSIEIARLAAPTGRHPTELVKMGIEAMAKSGVIAISPTATFREATELVVSKAKANGRRQRTIHSYRTFYSKLNRTFGDRIAATITASELRSYIAKLPNHRGEEGKAAVDTHNGYIRVIKTAYRALGVEKPFPDLVLVRVQREVKFLTNEQVRHAFTIADPNQRAMLALAVFAGLRPTLLSVLPPEAIDVEAKTIRIPAYLSKDKREHILEGEFMRSDGVLLRGLPPVLWEWLRVNPFKPQSWVSLQKRLKRAVGFWCQDITRHTAATNYLAMYGRQATADFLTHEGVSLVLKHYAGYTMRALADKFYQITPESIPPQPQPVMVAKAPVRWPSDTELSAMVWKIPTSQIAQQLGCSDAAISKRCRKRGIKKPGIGYWTKVAHGQQPVGRPVTSDEAA